MRRFGRGYRPDPKHFRTQRSSRALHTGAIALPEAFSAEHHEAPILDQNACGSCGGHGTAQALVVSHSYAGRPLGFVPSPGDIYRVTRAIERARDTPSAMALPALEDVGVYPSDVMHALERWGVRPMRAPSPLGFATDVDQLNVNNEVDLADLEESGKRIVTGQYRVDETAPDMVEQLCASLLKCGAVGIGVFVDTSFELWSPASGPLRAIDLDLEDPAGGGHWLAVTSYRTLANGTKAFRGPNSWTEAWGDRGHFEIDEDWLRLSCSDLIVFNTEAAA